MTQVVEMNTLFKVDDDQYNSIPAERSTTLKEILKSPAHYRHLKENGRFTRDLDFGIHVHRAILQPEKMSEYRIWSGGRRQGKDWERFSLAAEEADAPVVTSREMIVYRAIAERVLKEPVVRDLGLGSMKKEVALVFREPYTGAVCKCRFDAVDDVNHVVVGIKTARDVTGYEFARASVNFGYPFQWALYSLGYLEAFGLRPRMLEIAVEKEEPHDVVLYEILDDTIAFGERQVRAALNALKDCQTRNAWPGIGGGRPVAFELPRWVKGGDDDSDVTVTIGGEKVSL